MCVCRIVCVSECVHAYNVSWRGASSSFYYNLIMSLDDECG